MWNRRLFYNLTFWITEHSHGQKRKCSSCPTLSWSGSDLHSPRSSLATQCSSVFARFSTVGLRSDPRHSSQRWACFSAGSSTGCSPRQLPFLPVVAWTLSELIFWGYTFWWMTKTSNHNLSNGQLRKWLETFSFALIFRLPKPNYFWTFYTNHIITVLQLKRTIFFFLKLFGNICSVFYK